MATDTPAGFGRLAFESEGKHFPLQVLRSNAGYYIGTIDEDGFPLSRESKEYFRKQAEADQALAKGIWTQHGLSSLVPALLGF